MLTPYTVSLIHMNLIVLISHGMIENKSLSLIFLKQVYSILWLFQINRLIEESATLYLAYCIFHFTVNRNITDGTSSTTIQMSRIYASCSQSLVSNHLLRRQQTMELCNASKYGKAKRRSKAEETIIQRIKAKNRTPF